MSVTQTDSRIENNVVSLKLAIKLFEIGVGQESIFYWVRWKDQPMWAVKYPDSILRSEWKASPLIECYSAFTAAELIEKLPGFIRQSGEKYLLSIHKFCDGYVVGLERCYDNVLKFFLQEFESEKLADALAEILIWWRKRNERT